MLDDEEKAFFDFLIDIGTAMPLFVMLVREYLQTGRISMKHLFLLLGPSIFNELGVYHFQ